MWSKIEKIINEKKISVYQLAKMTGLTPQYFYLMKRQGSENPSFLTMIKVADALDVSLDEFR